MRLIKILNYKNWTVKVYDNGYKRFPHEYKILNRKKRVNDPTSTNGIKWCVTLAKEQVDYELKPKKLVKRYVTMHDGSVKCIERDLLHCLKC